MTPEREAELFAKLDLMLELYRRTENSLADTNRRMDAGFAEMSRRIERVEHGQGEISSRLHEVEKQVAELRGRIVEQSNILQVAIASRIGRKPAAE